MTAFKDRLTDLKRNQIQQINSYLDDSGRAKFDASQIRFIKYFEETDILGLGNCCHLVRGFFIQYTNAHNHDINGNHYEKLVRERLNEIDQNDYTEEDYLIEKNEIEAKISKSIVSHVLTLKTSRNRSSEFLLLNHYYYPIGIQDLVL